MEKTFLKRVSELQKELKSPKNQYNSFAKFRYRSAEDILESVKPLNEKYDVLLVIHDEVELHDGRYYVVANATLYDTQSDKKLHAKAYARESENKKGQDESQITGTASSYARKYALNGLYLIDDTKDPDTDEYKQQTQKKEQPKAITQKQVGDIKLKAKEFAALRNQDEKAVYEALKISDVTKLSESMATKTITTLNNWIKKANG